MRIVISALAAAAILSSAVAAQKASRERLNPVIALLGHNQPVFGVYWPANGGGRRGGDPPPARPAIDLAKDALGYRAADFLFSGSMEGGVDRGMPAYEAFVNAMIEAAGSAK